MAKCGGTCGCQATPAAASMTVPAGAVPLPDMPRRRSSFSLPGMDCPAEEQMVRLRLAASPVAAMHFDLAARRLVVDHGGAPDSILDLLLPLGYGAVLLDSQELGATEPPLAAQEEAGATVLWAMLAINGLMFGIELVAGWWSDSAGLIADAMDMFADAAVYGMALYAVGRSLQHKQRAARYSGWLQLLLALWALAETARRIVAAASPEGGTMIAISLLALAANVICLRLIARHRDGEVHMRASYIFTANDVLANLGVIVAGLLVGWVGQPWPDWLIGTAIGLLVFAGAVRILRLR